MKDWLRQWFCLPFLILLLLGVAGMAYAEESFVSPTRNPNAPPYDETKPEDLQDEQLVAEAFVLVEMESGTVIRSKNADVLKAPASITKIMTALLALQFCELNEQLTVGESAFDFNNEEDVQLVPFKVNETMTLGDALYGMLLRSGNEAANAIAEHVAGSQEAFVALMNEAAQMYGMTNTRFANAHGLNHPDHYTTAYDMALLTGIALKNTEFTKIVGTQEYTLLGTNQNPARKITNSNLLLDPNSTHYYYPYSIGVKTGFHTDAGYTLVSAAEKSGVTLITVCLNTGKYSRWPDAIWLLEYGFTQYKSVTPQQIYRQEPVELQIAGFAETDSDLGRLTLDIQAVDPSRIVRITGPVDTVNLLMESYRTFMNISWTREARAPIQKGEVMGVLTFIPSNDEPPAQYELVASRSIAARENSPPTLEEIEQAVLADPSPFPPFSWDWALPPLIILFLLIMLLRSLWRIWRKRRKNTKKVPKPQKRYFR